MHVRSRARVAASWRENPSPRGAHSPSVEGGPDHHRPQALFELDVFLLVLPDVPTGLFLLPTGRSPHLQEALLGPMVEIPTLRDLDLHRTFSRCFSGLAEGGPQNLHFDASKVCCDLATFFLACSLATSGVGDTRAVRFPPGSTLPMLFSMLRSLLGTCG